MKKINYDLKIGYRLILNVIHRGPDSVVFGSVSVTNPNISNMILAIKNFGNSYRASVVSDSIDY